MSETKMLFLILANIYIAQSFGSESAGRFLCGLIGAALIVVSFAA